MKEYIDQYLKEKLRRINMSDIISKYTNELEYLSKEDVTYILEKFECLKELFKWMEKVEEYAIAESIQKRDIQLWPNFKLMLTTRATDTFDMSKEKQIVETLKELAPKFNPYQKKLQTLSNIKKAIGIVNFDLLKDRGLIVSEGKPVLVHTHTENEKVKAFDFNHYEFVDQIRSENKKKLPES